MAHARRDQLPLLILWGPTVKNQSRGRLLPVIIGQVPALHDDELDVDTDLVRRLVAQSLPQCAGLSIRPLLSSGSSNALFRLGDSLLVRLPRQAGGSLTIEKEARWLPAIAPGLTAAVPEIVALGEPGLGYPEKWVVTKWLDGRVPVVPWDPDDGKSHGVAHDLAQFVTELHHLPVPARAYDDPALSWYRGGSLSGLDLEFRQAVDECRRIADLDLDVDLALDVWDDVVAAEGASRPTKTWYHGDLLAENLLMHEGELAAVLDFGGLAVGDPAVDLVVAWELLDSEDRNIFRGAVGVDDTAWMKGMGWALFIAMITFPYYWDTMPARCAARRSMAKAVLFEARPRFAPHVNHR